MNDEWLSKIERMSRSYPRTATMVIKDSRWVVAVGRNSAFVIGTRINPEDIEDRFPLVSAEWMSALPSFWSLSEKVPNANKINVILEHFYKWIKPKLTTDQIQPVLIGDNLFDRHRIADVLEFLDPGTITITLVTPVSNGRETLFVPPIIVMDSPNWRAIVAALLHRKNQKMVRNFNDIALILGIGIPETNLVEMDKDATQ